MSGRRLTWMREVNPKSREEVPLELDVDPAIAREHQIFSYRVELLGRLLFFTPCECLSDISLSHEQIFIDFINCTIVFAARTACKYLAELQPICDGAYGHLDEWLMRRCDV